MKSSDVEKELQLCAKSSVALQSKKYFKEYAGGYGDPDTFIGITVPVQRIVAKKYIDMSLSELKKLLTSTIHEYRFTSLLVLVYKYEQASDSEKKTIVDFYLTNKRYVNNWDLVDTSAPYILGNWLLTHDRSLLYDLIASKIVWDRRIAIVSTYTFIRAGDMRDILKLSKLVLNDTHDLIHKATGWMLREVGKKDEKSLLKFLDTYATRMPRTMLRYSLERLDVEKKSMYMKRDI